MEWLVSEHISIMQPMDIELLRNQYKDQILAIAKSRHIENVRLFGSVVHGTHNDDSDVDFLVHVTPQTGFGIGGMQVELEELLQRKVDVVPDTALHVALKERILGEAVRL